MFDLVRIFLQVPLPHSSLSPVLSRWTSLPLQPEFPFWLISQSSSLLFSGVANTSFLLPIHNAPSDIITLQWENNEEKCTSDRVCWDHLLCSSPVCFLFIPETFLPGTTYPAAWSSNINTQYLDSLWKYTIWDDKYPSPNWLEVTHLLLSKTNTEIFLISFVFGKFFEEKDPCWRCLQRS